MNCRNCGMPLTGPKCEYCDTDYSAEMRQKKPCFIWDENGITLYFETAQLSDTKLTASSAPEVLEE
ncbi:MAG: hypothetical protein II033_03980 [Clostridia bacterium]|nr:hypothetical protein [Clostridia bacterium]